MRRLYSWFEKVYTSTSLFGALGTVLTTILLWLNVGSVSAVDLPVSFRNKDGWGNYSISQIAGTNCYSSSLGNGLDWQNWYMNGTGGRMNPVELDLNGTKYTPNAEGWFNQLNGASENKTFYTYYDGSNWYITTSESDCKTKGVNPDKPATKPTITPFDEPIYSCGTKPITLPIPVVDDPDADGHWEYYYEGGFMGSGKGWKEITSAVTLSKGTYRVRYVAENSIGSTTSEEMTLIVSAPEVGAIPTLPTLCPGKTIDLSAYIPDVLGDCISEEKWQYYNSGWKDLPSTLANGTYRIRYSAKNSLGTTTSAEGSLKVQGGVPVITQSSITASYGDPLPTIAVNDNGVPVESFTWTNNGTPLDPATFRFAELTTYNLTYTATNACGTSSPKNFTVTTQARPKTYYLISNQRVSGTNVDFGGGKFGTPLNPAGSDCYSTMITDGAKNSEWYVAEDDGVLIPLTAEFAFGIWGNPGNPYNNTANSNGTHKPLQHDNFGNNFSGDHYTFYFYKKNGNWYASELGCGGVAMTDGLVITSNIESSDGCDDYIFKLKEIGDLGTDPIEWYYGTGSSSDAKLSSTTSYVSYIDDKELHISIRIQGQSYKANTRIYAKKGTHTSNDIPFSGLLLKTSKGSTFVYSRYTNTNCPDMCAFQTTESFNGGEEIWFERAGKKLPITIAPDVPSDIDVNSKGNLYSKSNTTYNFSYTKYLYYDKYDGWTFTFSAPCKCLFLSLDQSNRCVDGSADILVENNCGVPNWNWEKSTDKTNWSVVKSNSTGSLNITEKGYYRANSTSGGESNIVFFDPSSKVTMSDGGWTNYDFNITPNTCGECYYEIYSKLGDWNNNSYYLKDASGNNIDARLDPSVLTIVSKVGDTYKPFESHDLYKKIYLLHDGNNWTLTAENPCQCFTLTANRTALGCEGSATLTLDKSCDAITSWEWQKSANGNDGWTKVKDNGTTLTVTEEGYYRVIKGSDVSEVVKIGGSAINLWSNGDKFIQKYDNNCGLCYYKFGASDRGGSEFYIRDAGGSNLDVTLGRLDLGTDNGNKVVFTKNGQALQLSTGWSPYQVYLVNRNGTYELTTNDPCPCVVVNYTGGNLECDRYVTFEGDFKCSGTVTKWTWERQYSWGVQQDYLPNTKTVKITKTELDGVSAIRLKVTAGGNDYYSNWMAIDELPVLPFEFKPASQSPFGDKSTSTQLSVKKVEMLCCDNFKVTFTSDSKWADDEYAYVYAPDYNIYNAADGTPHIEMYFAHQSEDKSKHYWEVLGIRGDVNDGNGNASTADKVVYIYVDNENKRIFVNSDGYAGGNEPYLKDKVIGFDYNIPANFPCEPITITLATNPCGSTTNTSDYQWYGGYGRTNIPGATGKTLTVTGDMLEKYGFYYGVKVKVDGSSEAYRGGDLSWRISKPAFTGSDGLTVTGIIPLCCDDYGNKHYRINYTGAGTITLNTANYDAETTKSDGVYSIVKGGKTVNVTRADGSLFVYVKPDAAYWSVETPDPILVLNAPCNVCDDNKYTAVITNISETILNSFGSQKPKFVWEVSNNYRDWTVVGTDDDFLDGAIASSYMHCRVSTMFGCKVLTDEHSVLNCPNKPVATLSSDKNNKCDEANLKISKRDFDKFTCAYVEEIQGSDDKTNWYKVDDVTSSEVRIDKVIYTYYRYAAVVMEKDKYGNDVRTDRGVFSAPLSFKDVSDVTLTATYDRSFVYGVNSGQKHEVIVEAESNIDANYGYWEKLNPATGVWEDARTLGIPGAATTRLVYTIPNNDDEIKFRFVSEKVCQTSNEVKVGIDEIDVNCSVEGATIISFNGMGDNNGEFKVVKDDVQPYMFIHPKDTRCFQGFGSVHYADAYDVTTGQKYFQGQGLPLLGDDQTQYTFLGIDDCGRISRPENPRTGEHTKFPQYRDDVFTMGSDGCAYQIANRNKLSEIAGTNLVLPPTYSDNDIYYVWHHGGAHYITHNDMKSVPTIYPVLGIQYPSDIYPGAKGKVSLRFWFVGTNDDSPNNGGYFGFFSDRHGSSESAGELSKNPFLGGTLKFEGDADTPSWTVSMSNTNELMANSNENDCLTHCYVSNIKPGWYTMTAEFKFEGFITDNHCPVFYPMVLPENNNSAVAVEYMMTEMQEVDGHQVQELPLKPVVCASTESACAHDAISLFVKNLKNVRNFVDEIEIKWYNDATGEQVGRTLGLDDIASNIGHVEGGVARLDTEFPDADVNYVNYRCEVTMTKGATTSTFTNNVIVGRDPRCSNCVNIGEDLKDVVYTKTNDIRIQSTFVNLPVGVNYVWQWGSKRYMADSQWNPIPLTGSDARGTVSDGGATLTLTNLKKTDFFGDSLYIRVAVMDGEEPSQVLYCVSNGIKLTLAEEQCGWSFEGVTMINPKEYEAPANSTYRMVFHVANNEEWSKKQPKLNFSDVQSGRGGQWGPTGKNENGDWYIDIPATTDYELWINGDVFCQSAEHMFVRAIRECQSVSGDVVRVWYDDFGEFSDYANKTYPRVEKGGKDNKYSYHEKILYPNLGFDTYSREIEIDGKPATDAKYKYSYTLEPEAEKIWARDNSGALNVPFVTEFSPLKTCWDIDGFQLSNFASYEVTDGSYAIVSNALMGGCGDWSINTGDHTQASPSGKAGGMLFINMPGKGLVYSGEFKTQCKNAVVTISCYVANASQTVGSSACNVKMSVLTENGTEALSTYQSGDIFARIQNGYQDNIWTHLTFQAPLEPEDNDGNYHDGEYYYKFVIESNASSNQGNDFLFDDIEVYVCNPDVSIASENRVTHEQEIDLCIVDPLDAKVYAVPELPFSNFFADIEKLQVHWQLWTGGDDDYIGEWVDVYRSCADSGRAVHPGYVAGTPGDKYDFFYPLAEIGDYRLRVVVADKSDIEGILTEIKPYSSQLNLGSNWPKNDCALIYAHSDDFWVHVHERKNLKTIELSACPNDIVVLQDTLPKGYEYDYTDVSGKVLKSGKTTTDDEVVSAEVVKTTVFDTYYMVAHPGHFKSLGNEETMVCPRTTEYKLSVPKSIVIECEPNAVTLACASDYVDGVELPLSRPSLPFCVPDAEVVMEFQNIKKNGVEVGNKNNKWGGKLKGSLDDWTVKMGVADKGEYEVLWSAYAYKLNPETHERELGADGKPIRVATLPTVTKSCKISFDAYTEPTITLTVPDGDICPFKNDIELGGDLKTLYEAHESLHGDYEKYNKLTALKNINQLTKSSNASIYELKEIAAYVLRKFTNADRDNSYFYSTYYNTALGMTAPAEVFSFVVNKDNDANTTFEQKLVHDAHPSKNVYVQLDKYPNNSMDEPVYIVTVASRDAADRQTVDGLDYYSTVRLYSATDDIKAAGAYSANTFIDGGKNKLLVENSTFKANMDAAISKDDEAYYKFYDFAKDQYNKVNVKVENGTAPFHFEYENALGIGWVDTEDGENDALVIIKDCSTNPVEYTVKVTDAMGCVTTKPGSVEFNTDDVKVTYNAFKADGNDEDHRLVVKGENCKFKVPDFTKDANYTTATSGCELELTYTQSPVAGAEITGDTEVVLTATNGCDESATKSVFLTTNKPVWPDGGTLTAAKCYGDNSTYELDGDLTAYDVAVYDKDGAKTTITPDGSTFTLPYSTKYSIKLSHAASGCDTTYIVAIPQVSLVTLDAEANSPVCYGGNGTITATPAGGNAGTYTLKWGETESTITNVFVSATTEFEPDKTYYVQAFDAENCPSAKIPVSISQPEKVVLKTHIPNNAECSGGKGTITLAGDKGNGAPYTFKYGSSATSVTMPLTSSTPLDAGIYYVKAFDKELCESDAEKVTITQPEPFVAGEIAADGQSICEGGAISTIESSVPATSGVGTISYQWMVWNETAGKWDEIPGATSASYKPAVSGKYSRWAKDGVCQTEYSKATGEWTLTIHPKPVVKFGDTPTYLSCTETIEAVVTTNTAGATIGYWWNREDKAGQSSFVFNNGDKPATLYVVTDYGKVQCTSDEITYEPTLKSTITITAPDEVCPLANNFTQVMIDDLKDVRDEALSAYNFAKDTTGFYDAASLSPADGNVYWYKEIAAYIWRKFSNVDNDNNYFYVQYYKNIHHEKPCAEINFCHKDIIQGPVFFDATYTETSTKQDADVVKYLFQQEFKGKLPASIEGFFFKLHRDYDQDGKPVFQITVVSLSEADKILAKDKDGNPMINKNLPNDSADRSLYLYPCVRFSTASLSKEVCNNIKDPYTTTPKVIQTIPAGFSIARTYYMKADYTGIEGDVTNKNIAMPRAAMDRYNVAEAAYQKALASYQKQLEALGTVNEINVNVEPEHSYVFTYDSEKAIPKTANDANPNSALVKSGDCDATEARFVVHIDDKTTGCKYDTTVVFGVNGDNKVWFEGIPVEHKTWTILSDECVFTIPDFVHPDQDAIDRYMNDSRTQDLKRYLMAKSNCDLNITYTQNPPKGTRYDPFTNTPSQVVLTATNECGGKDEYVIELTSNMPTRWPEVKVLNPQCPVEPITVNITGWEPGYQYKVYSSPWDMHKGGVSQADEVIVDNVDESVPGQLSFILDPGPYYRVQFKHIESTCYNNPVVSVGKAQLEGLAINGTPKMCDAEADLTATGLSQSVIDGIDSGDLTVKWEVSRLEGNPSDYKIKGTKVWESSADVNINLTDVLRAFYADAVPGGDYYVRVTGKLKGSEECNWETDWYKVSLKSMAKFVNVNKRECNTSLSLVRDNASLAYPNLKELYENNQLVLGFDWKYYGNVKKSVVDPSKDSVARFYFTPEELDKYVSVTGDNEIVITYPFTWTDYDHIENGKELLQSSYTVFAEITDEEGCMWKATSSFSVTNDDKAIDGPGRWSKCSSPTYVLKEYNSSTKVIGDEIIPTGIDSINWYYKLRNGDYSIHDSLKGGKETQFSPLLDVTNTYKIYAFVYDENGCRSYYQKDAEVPTPEIRINDSTSTQSNNHPDSISLCQKLDLTATAWSDVTVKGTKEDVTDEYENVRWEISKDNKTYEPIPGNPTTKTYSFYPTETGIWWLKATLFNYYTDKNGDTQECPLWATHKIVVTNPVKANASEVCEGSEIEIEFDFKSNLDSPIYPDFIVKNSEENVVTAVGGKYTLSDVGTYKLTYTNSSLCNYSLAFTVNPNPEFDLESYTACTQHEVYFKDNKKTAADDEKVLEGTNTKNTYGFTYYDARMYNTLGRSSGDAISYYKPYSNNDTVRLFEEIVRYIDYLLSSGSLTKSDGVVVTYDNNKIQNNGQVEGLKNGAIEGSQKLGIYNKLVEKFGKTVIDNINYDVRNYNTTADPCVSITVASRLNYAYKDEHTAVRYITGVNEQVSGRNAYKTGYNNTKAIKPGWYLFSNNAFSHTDDGRLSGFLIDADYVRGTDNIVRDANYKTYDPAQMPPVAEYNRGFNVSATVTNAETGDYFDYDWANKAGEPWGNAGSNNAYVFSDICEGDIKYGLTVVNRRTLCHTTKNDGLLSIKLGDLKFDGYDAVDAVDASAPVVNVDGVRGAECKIYAPEIDFVNWSFTPCDATIDGDFVWSQSPAAGTEVSAGDVIELTGTYTTKHGCKVVKKVNAKFTISEPAPMSLSDVADGRVCEGGEYSAVINVTNGAEGYSVWNKDVKIDASKVTIDENEITVKVPAGSYVLTVKDANDCSADVSFNVTTIEVKKPEIDFTKVCEYDKVSLAVKNPNEALYTYSWVDGEGNPATTTDLTYADNDGDKFTLIATAKVKATDESVCTDKSDVFTLSFHSVPELTANVVTPKVCEKDGVITVSAEGGTGEYTFSINGSEAIYSAGQFSNLGASSYTVEVEDINRCKDTKSGLVIASYGDFSVGELNQVADICANASSLPTFDFKTAPTGDGTIKYQWYEGDAVAESKKISGGVGNTYTPEIAKDANGLYIAGTYTYTVYVTNNTDCGKGHLTTSFVVKPQPTVSIKADEKSCETDITFTPEVKIGETVVTEGITYEWTGTPALADASAATQTLKLGDADHVEGSYSVMATYNGCKSAPASNTADIYSKPTVTLHNPESSCAVSDDDYVVTAEISGYTTGASYEWTGATKIDDLSAKITKNDCGKDYTYSLKVTTVACEITEPGSFTTTTESPVLTRLDDITLNSTSKDCKFNLTAADVQPKFKVTNTCGKVDNLTWSYYSNAEGTASLTLPISDMTETTTIYVGVADACGKKSEILPIKVTIPGKPAAPGLTATSKSCENIANGEITVVPADGVTFTLGGKSPVDNKFSGLAAGTYTVVATDDNGCESKATATVENFDSYSVTADNITECYSVANKVTLSANVGGETDGYTFHWVKGVVDQTEAPSITSDNKSEITETWSVYAIDNNGCKSVVKDNVSMTIIPTPAVEIIAQDKSCEEDIVFKPVVKIGETVVTEGITYTWTGTPALADASAASQTLKLAAGATHSTATYTVVASVNGCEATSTPASATVYRKPYLGDFLVDDIDMVTGLRKTGYCSSEDRYGVEATFVTGEGAGYTEGTNSYVWTAEGTGVVEDGAHVKIKRDMTKRCGGTYNYSLTVTNDESGCSATNDGSFYAGLEEPTINKNPDPVK